MVIRFKTGIILVSLSILALIPGCSKQTKQAKREYTSTALPTLNIHNTQHAVSKNGVTFYSRVIPKEEGSQLFNGRGKKLYKGKKNAYLPIQLSIENNSAQSFKLKKSNISLKLQPDKKVVSKFARNSVMKVLAIFFGGLALTGLVAAPLIGLGMFYGFVLSLPFAFSIVNVGMLTGIGGIVGTSAGTASYVINKDIQKAPIIQDYYAKVLPEELEIQPYQKINKLIFVKARELKPFTITLENQTPMAKNVTAQINLPSDYAQQ